MFSSVVSLWFQYVQAKNEVCAALGCNGNILEEFAEQLAAETYDGELLPLSCKPADVKLSDGRLIQVKALASEDRNDALVSISHLWGYDFLLLVFFDNNGQIKWAGEVPAETVRQAAKRGSDCWTLLVNAGFRSRADVKEVSGTLCSCFGQEPFSTGSANIASLESQGSRTATSPRDPLLSLRNKEFAFACIDMLKTSSTLETDLACLLDSNFCKLNLKHSFAILKDATGKTSEEIRALVRDSHGNRRYYERVLMANNRTYVISNDWYGLGMHGRDNRTPFVNWVRDRSGQRL